MGDASRGEEGGHEGVQLIGGAALPSDVLRVIFDAFDAAWAEVRTDISARPEAIESTRLSLAAIVLSIAKAAPMGRDAINTAAVDAFRSKQRTGK